MRTDQSPLTSDQARKQLAATESRSLSSDRDRRIHARNIAVLGLSLSVYMATQNVVSGVSRMLLTGVFVAVWIGAALWAERAAPTVPRRARLWSRLGVGTSFVLALGLVLPWLNLQAQSQPNTWPMVLAGAVIAAMPSLVAAAVVARGRE